MLKAEYQAGEEEKREKTDTFLQRLCVPVPCYGMQQCIAMERSAVILNIFKEFKVSNNLIAIDTVLLKMSFSKQHSMPVLKFHSRIIVIGLGLCNEPEY